MQLSELVRLPSTTSSMYLYSLLNHADVWALDPGQAVRVCETWAFGSRYIKACPEKHGRETHQWGWQAKCPFYKEVAFQWI